jgi:hypothetical protein
MGRYQLSGAFSVSKVNSGLEQNKRANKQTLWSVSASQLYLPSNRRLSRRYFQPLRIEGVTWSE